MAKCKRCGKSMIFGKKIQLKDAVICGSCFKALGMTNVSYPEYYTLEEIKDGFDALVQRNQAKKKTTVKKTKEEDSYMFVVWDDTDIAKLQRTLNVEDEYEGMSNSDIKEMCDEDDRIYRYEQIELDAILTETELDGKPTYAVTVLDYDDKKYDVGHSSYKDYKKAKKIIEEHDPIITAIIAGGEYKYLYDDKVEKDDDNAYIRIVLDWCREIGENE